MTTDARPIPSATPAAAAVPWKTNRFLVAGFIVLNLLLLWGLPFLLPLHPAWGLLILPIILLTPTNWALIHESFHAALHPDRQWNDALGRILCVLFGSPFHVLRAGHLSHHRMNGRPVERPEALASQPNKTLARILFYPRLLFGVYLMELLFNVMVWLPRPTLRRALLIMFYDGHPEAPGIGEGVARQLLKPHRLRAMRIDAAAVIVLFVAAFWLYGAFWPWLAAALVGRALMISLLDNAFHYDMPDGDPSYGHNLRVPRWLATAMLNFNLHGVHHARAHLPWTALPEAFARSEGSYHGGMARFVLRQFRGPVERRDAA